MSDLRSLYNRMIHQLSDDPVVALCTIKDTKGSTPREVGAAMMVTASGAIAGTIGGGAFEHHVISEAIRHMAEGAATSLALTLPLGPAMGQCCGGVVSVGIDIYARDQVADLITQRDGLSASSPQGLYLFGAGHVGRAVVLALASLPFNVFWVDERADLFDMPVPRNVTARPSIDPVADIGKAATGAFVVIMTHSHALDFSLLDAALRRDDFNYVGVIGSLTKKARFQSRLKQAGHSAAALERFICPIGLAGVKGKEPSVIAASLAADLLIRREALQQANAPVHNSERVLRFGRV